jgi:hypothetical protein
MKRCPKCSRTFPDENQKFCTFDGGLLRPDQPAPPPFDPNLTVAISKESTPAPAAQDATEAPTSMQLPAMNETIASFSTSTFRETGPTGSPTTGDLTTADETAQTSADLGSFNQPTPVTVASSQNLAPPTLPPPAEPKKKKKSVLPWVLGGLFLLLLLGGGAVVAGYFLVLKPMMEKRGVIVAEPTNVNSNTAPSPADTTSPISESTPAETKKEPEPFVPPADAVQFTNSPAKLDGELADHYVGFSFYYPKAWTKDPKAGVPGASSFAKVDKQSSDNTGLQERVLFSWYPSKGSYEADASVFPVSAKKVTDQLSRALPNFEEVSHGDITVNTYKGYEVRFKGVFKNTGEEDLPYWGRVVFLPPGSEDEKGGVTIVMLATSLAPGITSAADVGAKGDTALILDSFRFASR